MESPDNKGGKAVDLLKDKASETLRQTKNVFGALSRSSSAGVKAARNKAALVKIKHELGKQAHQDGVVPDGLGTEIDAKQTAYNEACAALEDANTKLASIEDKVEKVKQSKDIAVCKAKEKAALLALEKEYSVLGDAILSAEDVDESLHSAIAEAKALHDAIEKEATAARSGLGELKDNPIGAAVFGIVLVLFLYVIAGVLFSSSSSGTDGGKTTADGESVAASKNDAKAGTMLSKVKFTEEVEKWVDLAAKAHPKGQECSMGEEECECASTVQVNCRNVSSTGPCSADHCASVECPPNGLRGSLRKNCIRLCLNGTCESTQRVCEGKICSHWSGVVRDGNRDGVWLEYHSISEEIEKAAKSPIKARRNYVAGSPEGLQETFHENGKKASEASYASGLPVGVWKTFYENGEKRSEREFKDGTELDSVRYWNSKGQREKCPDGHVLVSPDKFNCKDKQCAVSCRSKRGTGSQKGAAALSLASKTFHYGWPLSMTNRSRQGEVNSDEEWEGPVSDWYKTGEKLASLRFGKSRVGKFDKHGYKGLQTYWHRNGKKKSTVFYRKNVKEGTAYGWHENGKRQYEIEYKKGQVDGYRREWNKEGQKTYECSFKKGSRNGPCLLWFDDGKKKVEQNYAMGKKDGKWSSWYADGQQKSLVNFKDDAFVGEYKEWYENGKIRQKGNFTTGEFSNFDSSGKELPSFKLEGGIGQYLKYHGNGKVLVKGNVHRGRNDGEWITFHDNGAKKKSAHFLQGVRTGPFLEWYANGISKTKGEYKDGKKQGNWYEYGSTVMIYTKKQVKSRWVTKEFEMEDLSQAKVKNKAMEESYPFRTKTRSSYRDGEQISRETFRDKISPKEVKALKALSDAHKAKKAK